MQYISLLAPPTFNFNLGFAQKSIHSAFFFFFFSGSKDDGDEANMMERLKIQFYAVSQMVLMCFDLSFSSSSFWSAKFLFLRGEGKREKEDKILVLLRWEREVPECRCRWNGTVFQSEVNERGKKINCGGGKCQQRSKKLLGKEGRVRRRQLSVFSVLCFLSHRCVMSHLLGKSTFRLLSLCAVTGLFFPQIVHSAVPAAGEAVYVATACNQITVSAMIRKMSSLETRWADQQWWGLRWDDFGI